MSTAVPTSPPEGLTTPAPAGAGGDALGVAVSQLVVGYGGAPVLHGVTLDVAAGESVVLLGPSGCGKTTLLRAVAGLVHPVEGTVAIGGQEVSRPGRIVAPERRRVGMVFQDGALFPHLSVAANVAYGLSGMPGRDERVAEMLALVGLAGLGDRRPGTLSGGQAQRVALARALAPHPSVLLLDEPFSSLDAALRVQIRTEVHRLLRQIGVTTILVTHDQDEAFVLGERVAVLCEGAIRQVGTPAELYTAPADPWVATFVGEANLLDGRARGDAADTALGRLPLTSGDRPAGSVRVLVRPEQLRIDGGGPARVEVVEYYGHDTRYEVRLPGGELVGVRQAEPPRHQAGDAVAVRFAGGAARAWPA